MRLKYFGKATEFVLNWEEWEREREIYIKNKASAPNRWNYVKICKLSINRFTTHLNFCNVLNALVFYIFSERTQDFALEAFVRRYNRRKATKSSTIWDKQQQIFAQWKWVYETKSKPKIMWWWRWSLLSPSSSWFFFSTNWART